jgi:uncharacterized phiE125 gp8 family phage protein
MTMVRTVAPSELAVDIALARANLRVDGGDMDVLIASWVKGITRKLEHNVGQVFMAQTWEVSLPSFPRVGELIALPHPAMEITAVKYAAAGVETTLAAETYRLNVGNYASSLISASGFAWPTSDATDVVVTVKCGYGNTPDKTPETAQLFILAKLVEQFDPITRTERDTVQSAYLDSLVDDLKTYA